MEKKFALSFRERVLIYGLNLMKSIWGLWEEIWPRFTNSGRAVARLLPFGGKFYLCSKNDFKEAGLEILMTTFFSTMPFWMLPTFSRLILKNDIGFSAQFLDVINSGEVLIYCAAIVGPLIYIITRRYGERSTNDQNSGDTTTGDGFGYSISFPHGTMFVSLASLICLVSGGMYCFLKSPTLSNKQEEINFDGLFWASIFMFVVCIYCLFTASVYRNAMAPFLTSDSKNRAGLGQAESEEDIFAAMLQERRDAE